jgi:hypothetical protein
LDSSGQTIAAHGREITAHFLLQRSSMQSFHASGHGQQFEKNDEEELLDLFAQLCEME